MCCSYSVIPERWATEFLCQCHEIWNSDFTLMSRQHLFHTTNPNTVRHIGQFRTENLLLYIKEIICTTKNLTAKMLAKAFLFSTKFCSLTEELSELLGKQVWFCNPRHSLLAKNIQSSSYPERKGCFTVACLQEVHEVFLWGYGKKGLQNHSRQKRHWEIGIHNTLNQEDCSRWKQLSIIHAQTTTFQTGQHFCSWILIKILSLLLVLENTTPKSQWP